MSEKSCAVNTTGVQKIMASLERYKFKQKMAAFEGVFKLQQVLFDLFGVFECKPQRMQPQNWDVATKLR